jgi:hypothetical protein
VVVLLQDKHNYRKARNCDFLMMCAFQCTFCHFRSIQKQDPGCDDPADVFLLTSIRKVNLYALWAPTSSTVIHNDSTIRNIIRTCLEQCGVTESAVFAPQGTHPLKDSFIILNAWMFLYHSLKQGMNEENVQCETI